MNTWDLGAAGRLRAGLAILSALAGLPASGGSTAAPNATIAVRGTVLDDAGRPLPSARIELHAVEREVDAARRLLGGVSEAAPRASAAAGADGRFTLIAPESGFFVVIARVPDRVEMQFALSPLLEAVDLPEVRMPADTPLEVLVSDRLGKPIAGALVRARPDGFRDWTRDDLEHWQPAERFAITGTSGTVRLARRADESLDVAAIAAGCLPSVAAGVRESRVPLRLEAGAPYSVEVRGKANQPLAGAVILDGSRDARRGMPLAVTDARGRADVAGAATVDVTLRVLADGAAPAETTLGRSTGEGAPGASKPRAQIRLGELLPFGGRLRDADSRIPLGGGFVWPHQKAAEAVRTDASGAFSIALASPAVLWAVATDHAKTLIRQPGPGESRVVLLDAVRTLSGRVLDSGQHAVAHAELRLTFDGKPRQGFFQWRTWSAPAPVQSGADGRFRVAGLVGGTGYTLITRHEDYAPSTVEIAPLVSSAPPEVVVELRSGASASLLVLDASGVPVGNARARLIPVPPARLFDAGSPVPENGPHVVSSDTRGLASWRHLVAGTYSILLTAAGFAPTVIPNSLVADRPATEVTDLGTVRLAPAEELRGVVVDPDGNPVAGVSIWATRLEALYYAPVRQPDAVSATDGTFRVGDLTPGDRVDLSANRSGYDSAVTVRAEVPSHAFIRLVVRPSAALHVRGRVVDPAGKALLGAHLRLFPSRGFDNFTLPEYSATSDGEGSFTFGDVPSGSARLVAELPGWLPAQIEALDVPDGKDLDRVEVVLRPGSVVAGKVTDEEGHALPDMQIWFGHEPPPGMWTEYSVFTDGDGRYLLTAVPPGPQTIHATGTAGEAAQELTVEPGANRLDLKIGSGFEISGSVIDAEGEPASGASVRLLANSRVASYMGLHDGTSAADGSFTFTGIRDGEYRLESDLEGYATATLRPITVRGAAVSGLELRLGRGATIRGALRGLSFRELAQVRVNASFRDAVLAGRWGIVDAEGSYRIPAAASGEWNVTAELSNSRRSAHGSVTVPEGAGDVTLDLEFEEPGFTLTGRVRCGTSPLVQGSVTATPEQGASSSAEQPRSGYANTDGDGGFRIEGLEKGTYQLVVTAPRVGAYTENVEVAEETFVDIEIPVGNVRGRVVDADDATPLAGATVLLRPEGDGASRTYSRAMTVTDAQGMFRISDVSAGKWSASSEVDGYTGPRVAVDVSPHAGDVDVEVEIALRKGSGLALDVTGPSGPVREAVVAVLGADGEIVSAGHFNGSETGRVRIPEIPSGTYEVLIAGAGTAPARAVVTVPGPPAVVRLALGGRLQIRVPALAADAALRATVQLLGRDGPLRSPSWGLVRDSWRLRDGYVEIEGVPAGTWSVVVKAPDGRTWSATASAPPGGSQEVVLD